jgi:REP-associated tyrosine transposase
LSVLPTLSDVRRARAWKAGAIYHLTVSGNGRQPIFVDDVDREKFLSLAPEVARRDEVTIVGYCLMGNHLHLLVVAGPDGLSRFMQVLLGRFSRWANRRHGTEGHRFQGRFFTTPVTSDAQLWTTARYVDLNPVEAGFVDRPEQWHWSSYRAHVGLDPPQSLLANAAFLGYFDSTPERAMERYQRFVEAGLVRAVSGV